jgi:hypothetical protein
LNFDQRKVISLLSIEKENRRLYGIVKDQKSKFEVLHLLKFYL